MIEVTRLPKNRGGFERFPNEAARNPGLSLAALGLLARLLIDGHKFTSIAGVAERYASGKRGGGRDAYLEAAKELSAAGYLVRTQARGAGGRMVTTVAVYAEPVNAQVAPTTAEPVPVSPAESRVSARQTEDGSAVAGANRPDDANAQVAPGTAQPLSAPPAQMPVSAGRTENGSAVPLPYADVSQTSSDLSLRPAAEPSRSSRAQNEEGEGLIDQESQAGKPNADALADKVADAYEQALSGPRIPSVRRNIRAQALALLKGGDDPESLIRAAQAMPQRGWMDVGRAVAWLAVQAPAASAAPSGQRGSRWAGTEPCGRCDPIDRTRTTDDGKLAPCPICNQQRHADHINRYGDWRDPRQREEDEWYHKNWQWEQDAKRGIHRPRPVNAPAHLYEGLL